MTNRSKFPRSILIIEDDADQLEHYLAMARNAGFTTRGAITLKGALEALTSQSFQYVLTDIHLNGPGRQDTFEGLQILETIKQNYPETIPLAMTSDPKIASYDKIMAAGALHLFRKPILTGDELMINLDLATKSRRSGLAAKPKGVSRSLPPGLLRRCPDGIVLPQTIRDRVRRAALNSSLPIVIQGETGTGKEEIAKMIHRCRSEVERSVPFVPVNCANLTGEMAVSALFGHRKGAFTGADRNTNGFIGDADGGFLFLDEIQTLTMDCQQRLLRVLNDGTFNRLGDTKTLRSEFRVIVASTKDLDDQVEKGAFMLDLSTRLTGFSIKLSPLRERKEDLPLLVELALAKAGAQVPPETLAALTERCTQYFWQGNMRQLFQVINVLVTEARGEETEIRAENLPEFKTMFAPGQAPRPVVIPSKMGPQTPASASAEEALRAALAQDCHLDTTVGIIEKAIIQETFKRHPSIRAASTALGIARSTLTEKRLKYFGESEEH